MRIEHLAIWVQDLELMKDFYENYFEAKASKKYHNPTKNFTSYFLNFDIGTRLELMHRPDVKAYDKTEEHIGIAHFAIAIGSEDAVDKLTEALRKDGFDVVGEPRTTGDGYYESVVMDPEQNRIEITV